MDPIQLSDYQKQIESEIAARQAVLRAYELVLADIKRRESTTPITQEAGEKTPLTPCLTAVPAESIRRSPHNTPTAFPSGIATRILKAGYSERVREAIRYCPDTFTLDDVDAWLKSEGLATERKHISFVLSRLHAKKEIFLLERGLGKKAGVFSKIEPVQPEATGLEKSSVIPILPI